MLTKFYEVLTSDKKVNPTNGSTLTVPINWCVFEKSAEVKKKVKSAGLADEIVDSIVVEDTYQLRKVVGYGATSTVFKAHKYDKGERQSPQVRTILLEETQKPDERQHEVVAVKMIKNIFENEIMTHRILRELRLLRLLKGHPNIMTMKGIMRPSDLNKFQSINLVTEYCQ